MHRGFNLRVPDDSFAEYIVDGANQDVVKKATGGKLDCEGPHERVLGT